MKVLLVFRCALRRGDVVLMQHRYLDIQYLVFVTVFNM